jgi:hypothetical protein
MNWLNFIPKLEKEYFVGKFCIQVLKYDDGKYTTRIYNSENWKPIYKFEFKCKKMKTETDIEKLLLLL